MDQLLMRRHNLSDLPPIPELPPGYELREYREGDLPGLAMLLKSAFTDKGWSEDQVRQKLVDAPDVKKTYVIADGDNIIATTSARVLPERFPGSGYVHWVAVHPDRQGQRLGYAITLAVLHEFARMGLKDAVLETDDNRLAAIKTYQNLGFEPEHRNKLHIDRWAKVAADLLAAVNL